MIEYHEYHVYQVLLDEQYMNEIEYHDYQVKALLHRTRCHSR